jgi:hypothetical protein
VVTSQLTSGHRVSGVKGSRVFPREWRECEEERYRVVGSFSNSDFGSKIAIGRYRHLDALAVGDRRNEC